MDINDLLDGIMKSINRFAEPSACGHAQAGETAEHRLKKKMQGSRRGP